MTRRGVLTGGTWCIDRNILLDNWPQVNGRADILRADMSGGGSGCNMAIDIRKLDPSMPVATIALVGDDMEGNFLAALADKHGIERTRMHVSSEAQTDYTFAFSSLPTGQRTHISYFGTSHLLTPDHFDFAGLQHRIFHLGLPGIHNIMDAAWKDDANGWVTTLKKAKASGFATNMELASLAPDLLAALVRPCLPHLDLLVVNDHEIAGISGLETVRDGKADPAACEEAAKSGARHGRCADGGRAFPNGRGRRFQRRWRDKKALRQRAAFGGCGRERGRRCIRRRLRLWLSRRLGHRPSTDAGACRRGGLAPRDIDDGIRRRMEGLPGACAEMGLARRYSLKFKHGPWRNVARP